MIKTTSSEKTDIPIEEKKKNGQKPIWKKWWFWVAAVVIVITISSSGDDKPTVTTENPEANQPAIENSEGQPAQNEAGAAETEAVKPVNNSPAPEQPSQSKEDAQKELDNLMNIAKTAGLVSSYEFSDRATVVYADMIWYTQTVSFKKDFIAKVALLKEKITGYRHFEVRDAYSNEKLAEVTAFLGSLEVYK